MKLTKCIAIALLFAFTACRRGELATGQKPNSDIRVGQYGSFTGPQASYGQSIDKGLKLAIDDINHAGGVNGRQIQVFTEDDQSKSDEAATAVSRLITKDNVVAVIGEAASSSSLAGAPICQSAKIPMITPISTNPEVTKKGDYIFRMCFIDPYQGEALARYIFDDLKMRRAAILIDAKSDYSNGLAQFFERTFSQLGGTIVVKRSYANGDADFRSALTAIRTAKPEVVFVPGYYTDVGQIALQARDLGITQPLAGGDGWDSPKLLEIGGKALDGCFYSNHYYPSDPAPAVQQFVSRYKKRFGEVPDAFAVLGYDSTMLLADAMKRASTLDPKGIRDALAETRGFQAITGTITFDADRNPKDKKLIVVGISRGKITFKGVVDPSKKAKYNSH
jgi:branched-chain amino acid transport system substrate-binding protein